MRHLIICLIASTLLPFSCNEVSKEKRPLVNEINKKVGDIDANHRVQIIEDDFHQGDSIYKIRGYFMEGVLLKLVGVLYTPHVEREDFFYFDKKKPVFSGHLQVQKDKQIASEYKYYYDPATHRIDESLYWSDHYEKGKRFPHERFEEFQPNLDSLHTSEEERLNFFMEKLSLEGFEIRHLNENLDANDTNE